MAAQSVATTAVHEPARERCAKIIQFPSVINAQQPRTERQIRHERMAELLVGRAIRKGVSVSIEAARAAVTRSILEARL